MAVKVWLSDIMFSTKYNMKLIPETVFAVSGIFMHDCVDYRAVKYIAGIQIIGYTVFIKLRQSLGEGVNRWVK